MPPEPVRAGRPSSRGSRQNGATPSPGCPVGEVFAMLGRPHMLRILGRMVADPGRPLRFTALQAELRLSPKTLAERLRTLVEAGFLTRRSYSEIPPRVEYEATAKAVELGELFALIEHWAQRNTLTAVPTVSVVGRVRSPVHSA